MAATAIATWAVSPTPSRMAIPASAAPAAPPRLKNVKRRHDRTLIAALDGERVGIHRHVEGAVRSAEHGQRERENVVADDGKGQRQTRREAGEHGHRTATEAADEPAGEGEREHRAGRHGQEDRAQLPIAQRVAALHRGNVRHPAGDRRAVDEEDLRDRPAGPREHRPVGNARVGRGFIRPHPASLCRCLKARDRRGGSTAWTVRP